MDLYVGLLEHWQTRNFKFKFNQLTLPTIYVSLGMSLHMWVNIVHNTGRLAICFISRPSIFRITWVSTGILPGVPAKKWGPTWSDCRKPSVVLTLNLKLFPRLFSLLPPWLLHQGCTPPPFSDFFYSPSLFPLHLIPTHTTRPGRNIQEYTSRTVAMGGKPWTSKGCVDCRRRKIKVIMASPPKGLSWG